MDTKETLKNLLHAIINGDTETAEKALHDVMVHKGKGLTDKEVEQDNKDD